MILPTNRKNIFSSSKEASHQTHPVCISEDTYTYGSLFGNYCRMFPWLLWCCCSLRVWWTLSDWRNLWPLVPRSLESGWAWGLAFHVTLSAFYQRLWVPSWWSLGCVFQVRRKRPTWKSSFLWALQWLPCSSGCFLSLFCGPLSG